MDTMPMEKIQTIEGKLSNLETTITKAETDLFGFLELPIDERNIPISNQPVERCIQTIEDLNVRLINVIATLNKEVYSKIKEK
jgi:hypothetical protein